MRNDIDLVRAILQEVSRRTSLHPREVSLAGFDPLAVARHCERMYADGLLYGEVESILGKPYLTVYATDLTSLGHETLASLESDTVWTQLKKRLSPAEIASLSIRALSRLAIDLGEQIIRGKLGL